MSSLLSVVGELPITRQQTVLIESNYCHDPNPQTMNSNA